MYDEVSVKSGANTLYLHIFKYIFKHPYGCILCASSWPSGDIGERHMCAFPYILGHSEG